MTKNENQASAKNLPTAKPSGMPSTRLSSTFEDVVPRLDTEIRTGLESVVSVTGANAILSELIARDEPCSADDAVVMARYLIGIYPAREVGKCTEFMERSALAISSVPSQRALGDLQPLTYLAVYALILKEWGHC